jgi:hypothetical protein
MDTETQALVVCQAAVAAAALLLLVAGVMDNGATESTLLDP